MNRFLAVVFLLLLGTGCWAQGTQTFTTYFNNLPAATTPLAGTESTIVLQNGLTRQTPVNSTSGGPLKIISSNATVLPALTSSGFVELINLNSGMGGSGSQVRFGTTIGNPYAIIASYLNDGTPPGAGYLAIATRNGSGGSLTNHLFVAPSSVGTLVSANTPTDSHLIGSLSANFSGYNRSGQQVFAGFSQTGDDPNHVGTQTGYFVSSNTDTSGLNVSATGVYAESRQVNNQFTLGAEIDTQNLGGTPRLVDPYHQFGTTASPIGYAIWSQPNGTGAGPVFDSSAFMGVTGGGSNARFQKGIVFGSDAIATVSGHKEVIAAATGQEITWYDGSGNVNRISGDGVNVNITGNSITSGIVSGASFTVSGQTGVTCFAGTVSIATFTVTNGIVTHC